jgi:thermitase
MGGSPMIKNVLHFLLVALFLFLPCLTLAEEPRPTTTHPAPPSSPPILRQAQDTALGGKEGGRGTMEFKAGEIIVKFKKGMSQASVQSLLLAEDVNILDEMDDLGLLLLRVPKGRELEKIEELKRNPLVEYAEPNYVVQAANAIAAEPHYDLHNLRALDVEPNDPYYPAQWNLRKIEAPVAWDITTGSDRVVIAVIDSGVDLDHRELKDKLWTNPGEIIPNDGKDDDGNGYADDVHGWDFVIENWDNEPQDDLGLGTFVATVAAAETNNGYGIAGVSWGAEIMPVKVLDRDGGGDIWEINPGIKYAADNGANVLILDFLVFYYAYALEARIDYAYQKGALLVAPMGDCVEGKDLSRCHHLENPVVYPAAFPQVVAVAATGQNDEHLGFSGYKPYVDVAAPGWRIPGFWLDEDHYAQYSSTAFATPHVAGLAALIWSVNPYLTNVQVTGIITSTAVDVEDPGWDEYTGWGRIDAGAAVMTTTHYLQVEYDDPFSFLVCDDCESPSRKITNLYTNCSTWRATAEAPWLSISDCEGYTPSSVTVSIDKGGLSAYDVYTDVITVTSTLTNHVNNPLTIPVTAIYAQCRRIYLPLLFKNHSS